MKPRFIITSSLFLAAIVVVLVGCGQKFAATEEAEDSPGATGVFALSFEDYEGNAVSLNDFEGRPLIVNSWAGWCAFCKKELVDFASAKKQFGSDVVIIAINRSESPEKAKEFSDGVGDTTGVTFWVDDQDRFYKTIGGFAMPETIFVDAEGNTVFHKRGPMDVEEILNRVNTLFGIAIN